MMNNNIELTVTTAKTMTHSASIRAELKKRGWTSRDVSVTTQNYAGGSSIRVKINNAAIKIADVKSIAHAHESIRRDERTGDILGGGNRYVNVSYSVEALNTLGARYSDAVSAACDKLRVYADKTGMTACGTLVRVEGTSFFLGVATYAKPSDLFWLSVWSETSHVQSGLTELTAAQLIGVKELQ